MCSCHPETETLEWRKRWRQAQAEPRTREDWVDLHDTIEAYRRRLVERHTLAKPPTDASAQPGTGLKGE